MRKPLFGKRETIKRFRGTGAQGGRRSPVAYFWYAGRDQATEQLHRRIDASERTDSRSEHLLETIARQQATNQETERRLSTVEARLLQQEQNRKKLKQLEQELIEKQETANRWENSIN